MSLQCQWFKNHTGACLTEEQFKDIPSPRIELTTHVTIKTVQAFGLLGTVLIGPLIGLKQGSLANVVRWSAKGGKIGAVAGLLVGPPLCYARMRSLEDDAVVDRCYRLRHNRGQVRVDQASAVGAVAGGVVGALMPMSTPHGCLLGMCGGILTMAVYNNL